MQEVQSVQWDLFKSSVVDKSTTSQQWVEYKEDRVNLEDNQQTFRISTKDLDSFLVPSEGALELRVQLRTANGAAVAPANSNATLVNDISAIFRSSEYKANEKLVERSDYVGLCSQMKHLSCDDPSYSDSQGQMMMYYQDSGLGDIYGQNPDADDAAGFENRKERAFRGAAGVAGEMNLFIPLRHLFGSHMEKKAIRGLRHTYEFTKETNLPSVIHRSNNIEGGNGAQPDLNFKIIDMSIWMPLVKPSLDALKGIEEKLASGAVAERVFHEWTGYRSTAFQGDTQPVWRITTSSKKPVMVFLCAKLAQRHSLQRLNAQKNDHLNATRVELRVNSKVIPEQTFNLDFPNDRYTRAYYDWLTATSRHTGDEGSNISYDDFKNLYTVWAFDLSAQEHLYQNVKTNDIEVRLQCDPAAYAGALEGLSTVAGQIRTVDDAAAAAGGGEAANGTTLAVSPNYHLEAVIVSERVARFEGVSGRVSMAV